MMMRLRMFIRHIKLEQLLMVDKIVLIASGIISLSMVYLAPATGAGANAEVAGLWYLAAFVGLGLAGLMVLGEHFDVMHSGLGAAILVGTFTTSIIVANWIVTVVTALALYAVIRDGVETEEPPARWMWGAGIALIVLLVLTAILCRALGMYN